MKELKIGDDVCNGQIYGQILNIKENVATILLKGTWNGVAYVPLEAVSLVEESRSRTSEEIKKLPVREPVVDKSENPQPTVASMRLAAAIGLAVGIIVGVSL